LELEVDILGMDKQRKTFSRIYDQYVDKLYRFVFLRVSSQEVAEDLTSKVFLKGWEAFKNSGNCGENTINNPQAFLYQIARNTVVDYYRERGKAQIVSAEYAPQIADPRINLEEKTAVNSDLAMVKGALQNLKEEYQKVVIWHYLDDLSISEIAKILDKPEGTIRVTLHRALKKLKNELIEEA